MKQLIAKTLMAAALCSATSACYSDEPPPQYAGEDDGTGDLVEVSPGVEVLADYGEPIFFSDDYYWVQRGGLWFQSTWYGGGWVRAGHVPGGVIGIPHPEMYVHYRPAGWERHEAVHGGYESHAQYHAAHPAAGGMHIRAAVRGGGGGHRR